MNGSTAALRDRLMQQRASFDQMEASRRRLASEFRSQINSTSAQQPRSSRKSSGGGESQSRITTVFAIACSIAAVVVPAWALFPRMARFQLAFANTICDARYLIGMGRQEAVSAIAAYDELLSSPPLVNTPEHDQSLKWGLYDSSALIGVRSRSSQPLRVGFAWGPTTQDSPVPVRFSSVNTTITMQWDVNDGRFYGRKTIEDPQLGVQFSVRFLKRPDGRGWTLSVDGVRSALTHTPSASSTERHRHHSLRGNSYEPGGAASSSITVYIFFVSALPADDPIRVLSSQGPQSNVAERGLSTGAFSTSHGVVLKGPLHGNGREHLRFRAEVTDKLTGTGSSQWSAFGSTVEEQQMPSGDGRLSFDFRRPGGLLQEHQLFMRPARRQNRVILEKSFSSDFSISTTLLEHEGHDVVDRFRDQCTAYRLMARAETTFHQRVAQLLRRSRLTFSGLLASGGAPPAPDAVLRMLIASVAQTFGSLSVIPRSPVAAAKTDEFKAGRDAEHSGEPLGFAASPGFSPTVETDAAVAAAMSQWDTPLFQDVVQGRLRRLATGGDAPARNALAVAQFADAATELARDRVHAGVFDGFARAAHHSLAAVYAAGVGACASFRPGACAAPVAGASIPAAGAFRPPGDEGSALDIPHATGASAAAQPALKCPADHTRWDLHAVSAAAQVRRALVALARAAEGGVDEAAGGAGGSGEPEGGVAAVVTGIFWDEANHRFSASACTSNAAWGKAAAALDAAGRPSVPATKKGDCGGTAAGGTGSETDCGAGSVDAVFAARLAEATGATEINAIRTSAAAAVTQRSELSSPTVVAGAAGALLPGGAAATAAGPELLTAVDLARQQLAGPFGLQSRANASTAPAAAASTAVSASAVVELVANHRVAQTLLGHAGATIEAAGAGGELAGAIRRDVLGLVFREWTRTGGFFAAYDSNSGRGIGTPLAPSASLAAALFVLL